jgi:hypothetical protein
MSGRMKVQWVDVAIVDADVRSEEKELPRFSFWRPAWTW